ncbi:MULTISPECIES: hypothetical protein [unclassified Nocardia]|uniref:hypothetical protein n=1 Tax=unclassified Nocardia TaxID=2637762 RepID=UPI0024A8D02F|nr:MULTISPECIES: hypothetical protein [unclassified Nocardia]
MLRQFPFHPFVDIVNEFAAPTIDLGGKERVGHLRAAFVQFRERVRRPEQNPVLETPALEGAEQLRGGRQPAGYGYGHRDSQNVPDNITIRTNMIGLRIQLYRSSDRSYKN